MFYDLLEEITDDVGCLRAFEELLEERDWPGEDSCMTGWLIGLLNEGHKASLDRI